MVLAKEATVGNSVIAKSSNISYGVETNSLKKPSQSNLERVDLSEPSNCIDFILDFGTKKNDVSIVFNQFVDHFSYF